MSTGHTSSRNTLVRSFLLATVCLSVLPSLAQQQPQQQQSQQSQQPLQPPPPAQDLVLEEAEAFLIAANSGETSGGRAPAARSQQRRASERERTQTRARTSNSASRVQQGRANSSPNGKKKNPYLAKARSLAASGQYQEASKLLFQMSRSPQFERESAQIKYILGLMLFEMKLNQSAAFVFYDVIRQQGHENTKSRYLRQALGKLALAADSLDSDVLLRYAVKQVNEEEFPVASRDMLHFRTGEIKMSEKAFAEAAREFSRVQSNSIFYARALYKQGLAYAEAGDTDRAIGAFDVLASMSVSTTDKNRLSAVLGKARALYQRQNFAAAIEAYREIPRDTEQWHEALFESTWAMLRDGRFRSALSNFHSLHSPYYEDFYQPESLLLRAIVYLYICRYDEMDKVIELFERVYKPVYSNIRNMLRSVSEPVTYYREVAKVSENFDSIRSGKFRRTMQIPFVVARHILKEGDVRRTFNYLGKLEEEKRRIESMPESWKGSGIGRYAKRVVEKRIEATQAFAGKQIRRHMFIMQTELRDLMEQSGFLRFEMISGKKESLRKEIAGKGLARQNVDEDTNRNFFIQNGFEYWPFTGEYWLDEIGNYHYVGVKACE